MTRRRRRRRPGGRRRAMPVAALFLAIAAVLAWYAADPRRPAALGTPFAQGRRTGETIVVGAWNIEWLGRPQARGGVGRGVEQRPEDLADYIVFSGVDVLGLVEVISEGGSHPIRNRVIEETVEVLGRDGGARWEYTLFPGRSRGDQLTGVMWNTAVVQARHPDGRAWGQHDRAYRLPVSGRKSAQGSVLWHRPPHAMMFSAGPGLTDFVVIVLHMKSDYNGDFSAHRAEEAAELGALLPGVAARFGDGDIYLVGDINTTAPGEAAERAYVSMTFESGPLAGARYVNLNEAGLSTHVASGPLDTVFARRDQPEFTGEFWVVGGAYLGARGLSEAEFRRRLSDHMMVVTGVRVGPDDD